MSTTSDRGSGLDFLRNCSIARSRLEGKVQSPTALSGAGLPELPAHWVWSSLSNVCKRVSVGHVGPTSEFFSTRPDSIPLIRSQDVRPGKLNTDGCARVTPGFHSKLRKSQLRGGDILVVRVGANRGDSCAVPYGLGELNCANIVFARPMIDTGFFGYFTRSELGQHLLLSTTTGAAQGVINTHSVAALPVPVPPENVQRRIASILSAYDDLIENNTRRIAILGEMARRIYEEWFVRFRFPGHEHVRMVESELGPVPEGWRVQGLYDVAELTYGFPFKSKLFDTANEGVGVIRIRDIKGNQTNTYTTEPADQKYRVKNGDILVGMDGEFHMGCWAGGDAWLNQRVVRFRPRRGIPRSWLFLTTHEPIKVLESTIVGTTVAHLSAKDLKEMRIVVPDPKVLERAGETLESSFDLALTLKLANANLRTTRDLLLPKLISGELDVSALPEPETVAA